MLQRHVYNKMFCFPFFSFASIFIFNTSTMFTRSQGPITVQCINQDVLLLDKRKCEPLSSVTVSLGDPFYPPQFNRICSQESVNTDPSTVAPEEHEGNSQITMALDSKTQQNIIEMIELAAPSDQDTKDVANHVAQKKHLP